MKMKKVLLVILSIIIAQPVFAGKGRQPCSGKKEALNIVPLIKNLCAMMELLVLQKSM